jgi:hypothetical protein
MKKNIVIQTTRGDREPKSIATSSTSLRNTNWRGGEDKMTNNGIVNIQGKDYMTVARRVEIARDARTLDGIDTEVISHSPVVVKARVTIDGKVFTGISSVSLDSVKQIEKQNPYEVAETSAVGRALGFAGYGIIEGIASADEMIKAGVYTNTAQTETSEQKATCEVCGKEALERKGTTKGGKQYHGIFCTSEDKSHTRWLWN